MRIQLNLHEATAIIAAHFKIDPSDVTILSEGDFEDEVKRIYSKKGPLAAIKFVRLERGASLLDSKNFVDELCEGPKLLNSHQNN